MKAIKRPGNSAARKVFERDDIGLKLGEFADGKPAVLKVSPGEFDKQFEAGSIAHALSKGDPSVLRDCLQRLRITKRRDPAELFAEWRDIRETFRSRTK